MPLPIYEPGQAAEYITGKGWSFRRSGDEMLLESCPFCAKKWKLYVNDLSGLWECKGGACGSKGNFYTLRKSQGDISERATTRDESQEKRYQVDSLASFETTLHADPDALAYLAGRGLSDATMREFHLGVKIEGGVKWLMIPYIKNGEVVDIKYRSLPPTEKRFRRLRNRESILFGSGLMAKAKQEGRTTLYLCEGEIDAMTLWQHGFWPALSTTTGAASFASAWYDQIVGFSPDKIVLCYDSDVPGQKGSDVLQKKFNEFTCLNILLPDGVKDANEYFQHFAAADFQQLVDDAKAPEIENCKPMKRVVDMLEEQLFLSTDAFDGLPSMFSDINTMTEGGYWNGQLITLSGPSGTGKTSLVLQEMLQWAKNGIPSYLLCLEMPETMMLRKIISKEYGIPILKITLEHVKKFRHQLDVLGLHLGSKVKNLDDLEKTVRLAVKRYGIKAIAFDNLHFLVRSKEHAEQEIALTTRLFKDLAVELEIPFIAIAQPRKFDQETRTMRGDDLKGSSAIEADSDIIILLHRQRIKTEAKDLGKGTNAAGFLGSKSPYCHVRVDKSRYSSGGETYLFFDGARSTYRDLTDAERESMANAA